MNDTTRICLWSGPRNVSTALMYAFAQRNDTKVYDEPMYGFYLKNTSAAAYHPGAAVVIEKMETDGEKVVAMMMGPQPKPVAFFKGMTHHLLDLDRSFMQATVNVILTRDPIEMLPSFAQVIDMPTMEDVGYAQHVELLDQLSAMGNPPLVLDGKHLLMNPEGVLRQLCAAIGIPFDPAMLQWEAGPLPEDGVWAPYWYHNVHQSTGFQTYQPKQTPFPEKLRPLLAECLPHYERLHALALK